MRKKLYLRAHFERFALHYRGEFFVVFKSLFYYICFGTIIEINFAIDYLKSLCVQIFCG